MQCYVCSNASYFAILASLIACLILFSWNAALLWKSVQCRHFSDALFLCVCAWSEMSKVKNLHFIKRSYLNELGYTMCCLHLFAYLNLTCLHPGFLICGIAALKRFFCLWHPNICGLKEIVQKNKNFLIIYTPKSICLSLFSWREMKVLEKNDFSFFQCKWMGLTVDCFQ